MASESRPVTDDQLRRAVGKPAADQWADDTDRALRAKWGDPKNLEAMLTGVPAGERRTWWVQQLTRHAHERTEAFHLTAGARRRELAEQVFALLQAVEPRPTEDEVARPTAEFRSMVAGLAPATAAGRELLAMAADIDAAVTEVVDRAPTLDEVRARRASQLTLACEEARADLARVDQLVAGVPEMTEPGIAKLVIELDIDLDADPPITRTLRVAIPNERRPGEQADRAVWEVLERALRDDDVKNLSMEKLRQALVAPFNTAVSAAMSSQLKAARLKRAVDARVAGYNQRFRFPNEPAVESLEYFFVHYGRPAVETVYDYVRSASEQNAWAFFRRTVYLQPIVIPIFEEFGLNNPPKDLLRELCQRIGSSPTDQETSIRSVVQELCIMTVGIPEPGDPEGA